MFLYNLLKTLSVEDALVQTGGLCTKICQLKGTKNTESIITTPKHNTILIEYLQDENIFKKLKHIKEQPYKNGSIGSVYLGELYSGTVVCLKVLHNEIQDKLESQIKLLKSSSSLLKLLGFNIGMVGEELESMFLSETNMLLEMKNQENFIRMWHDVHWICIPAVIPKMCTQSVLCTEFLESVPLKEYVGDKNLLAFRLATFVYRSHIRHHSFYTDIHWGNFLVSADNKLIVVDFGSVKNLNKIQSTQIHSFYTSLMNRDFNTFVETTIHMGIITRDTLFLEELYKLFLMQCKPWITRGNFEFTEDWLQQSTTVKVEWLRHWKLPSELVWFLRISFGLNKILTYMRAQGDFSLILLEELCLL